MPTGRLTQPLPGRQQHPPGRPSRVDRGQRARGAPAPGRRQVLLRPGPQEDAGIARAGAGQGGLPRQAGHAGRARRARARASPAPSASSSAAPALAAQRRPRRAAGQGRPADRHGGRVPRAAGHHGRLLRAPRRRDRGRGLRHRGPLQAALRRRRAAAQATPAWWWRWPTSWRRWPACSASASCPPATRIRSRCAAMRWA